MNSMEECDSLRSVHDVYICLVFGLFVMCPSIIKWILTQIDKNLKFMTYLVLVYI